MLDINVYRVLVSCVPLTSLFLNRWRTVQEQTIVVCVLNSSTRKLFLSIVYIVFLLIFSHLVLKRRQGEGRGGVVFCSFVLPGKEQRRFFIQSDYNCRRTGNLALNSLGPTIMELV